MRRSAAIYLLPLLLVATSLAQMAGEPARHGPLGRLLAPARATAPDPGPAPAAERGPGGDLIGRIRPESGPRAQWLERWLRDGPPPLAPVPRPRA